MPVSSSGSRLKSASAVEHSPSLSAATSASSYNGDPKLDPVCLIESKCLPLAKPNERNAAAGDPVLHGEVVVAQENRKRVKIRIVRAIENDTQKRRKP